MDSRDIIACVKKYPVVYDLSTQRTLARRDAWKEIAAELQTNVATVQKKWKNLRDSYVKFSNTPSLTFRLEVQMQFLKPYLPIPTSSNASGSTKNAKSRNVRKQNVKQGEEVDSDDKNEKSTSLRDRKIKTNKPKDVQRYSSSESGNESNSSTNTINDSIDHLQLNESSIINSATIDEKFVDFANRVKKLSQNNILAIFDHVSQIIDENVESERSHVNNNIKMKLRNYNK